MRTNNTTVSFEFESESMTKTYIKIILFVISILGAVSNVLLLVAININPLKCFRNSGTYLIMNLSVSDCLTCLLVPFLQVASITPSPSIGYFFVGWLVIVSYLSIMSISIDRFLIVTYPIKYRILINGKVMVLWIAAIWVVSCVIPLFQMVQDIHDASGVNALYIFSIIVTIISAVIYSGTYYKLKRQSRNIALQNSIKSRAQEKRILKEKQFLKTIVIIASISFVCVVPPMALHVIHLFVHNSTTKMASMLLSVLFYTNFAVNPLIYILRLPNYRKTFHLIYCKRLAISE